MAQGADWRFAVRRSGLIVGGMIGLNEDYARPRPPASEPAPDLMRLPSLVGQVFAADGPLVRQLGLEHRPEQSQRALAVAQAMVGNEALLFEAGTGVGKSLAYLLPGLVQAQLAERPCLVSTHTIALQEQILQKDLELCRTLFQRLPALQPFARFRVALLVGRSNYLCGTRLAQAIETKTELFPSDQMRELERIAEWSQVTKKGLVQELSPGPLHEVWEWVCADGHACNKRNCSPDNCLYRRALEEVRKSHLVVVNHALLFALVGAGMQPRGEVKGVLFPDDFVVLDEAHRVPGVAAEHFGQRISAYGLDRLLARLYSTRGKGQKARGLLTRHGSEALRALVRSAREEAKAFFGRVEEKFLTQREEVRCHDPDWIDDAVLPPLQALHKGLSDLVGRMEDGPARDELGGAKGEVGSYLNGLRECLQLADEEQVYWVERSGRRRSIVSLRSAPIDVADALRQHLFRRRTSVTLTSATLAEGTRMDSFQEKIGATGAHAEMVASPFDYARNVRVFVATDAPMPTRQAARLDRDYLAEMIAFCCERVRGGSLVLFTSYGDLTACAERAGPVLRKAGRPFYQQGRDGSRQELANRLRRDGHGVLFGTESFWTGIDVPGPSLSQVIITRLPFENPSHPIAEARAEWCQARGGNPFQDITVPEALIKFRQGIGRLIRRATDRGTITVLDSRIVQRPYGREFLAVLPVARYTRFDRGNRDELFQPLEG